MFTVLLPLLLIGVLAAVGQGAGKPAGEIEGKAATSNVPGRQYPRINADQTVTFRAEAPNAREVAVEPRDGEFGTMPYPMAKGVDGVWWVTTPPVAPGFHYYGLIIDGVPCTDPNSESFFGYGRPTSGLEVPDPLLKFYEPLDVPHGEVREVRYHSKVTGAMRRTYVYTPPGYETSLKSYPVLYLQHGAGESESAWTEQGRANFILDNLIAAKKAEPMLVVMDNGYATDTRLTTGVKRDAFTSVLLEDLIPVIDSGFRTVPNAENRAIAGLSMGGGQALNIGIHNLDRFHWIGSLSGAVRNFSLAGSPLENTAKANKTLDLLWIGCGTDDSLLASNEALSKSLDLAGIRHRWFTCSGAHVWQTWRKHLSEIAPLLFQHRQPVSATDLRCEYLTEPLGLDVSRPRLSWRMEVADPQMRSVEQRAYRVLVASTQELLDTDHGDLWDSGMVKSGQSTQIEYGGAPLGSHQSCWWKVRLVDDGHRRTPWSHPAHWTIGLLHASDWKADWIGCDEVFGHPPKSPNYITHENTVPDPWFRKSFALPSKPARAVMYLASVGYQELYVNGVKAGDAVLEPGVTDNGKQARYVVYEIGPLLRQGQNVIAIWLGVSWSIFPHFASAAIGRPLTPLALGQVEVWLPDSHHITLSTDATWKTHPSPNKLLGVWDFMNFGGEEYDARFELQGWSLPGFDDAAWNAATVYHPKLEVSADNDARNRKVREVFANDVKPQPDGAYRVDMGVNFAGWVEIPVRGEPGDRIEFEFSERPDHEITHKLHSAYIIGPSGWGVFRNRFNYGVGRWITIKGLKYAPTRNEIQGWLVRTDFERAAQFDCSNPMLNQIYDMTLWTFENLSLGGYVVDCPQRERMGYGGDGHATTQAALDNYKMGAFYTKWAADWRDVQSPDGNLPYTAPTYWGGGGPVWQGFCVFMPWQVYRHYGDVRILRDEYPTMKRWLAFMEAHSKEDLLVRWGGEWDFLGDWLWPGAEGVNGDTPETLCLNNCYWVYALRLAAKAADVIGLEDDAKAYRQRADRVSAAINARFYDAGTHRYATGGQAYQAAALLAGIPTEAETAPAWKVLEDEILIHRHGHIYAGITGGALLTRLLLDSGRGDLMYPMVAATGYPGWGDFIAKGHTTIPEDWEGAQSQLHSSYLFVGAWFIEGPAGIYQSPTDVGYKHFELAPLIDIDPTLDRAAATFDSPYGRILCSWKRLDGRFELAVTVPANSSATLRLPTQAAGAVTESGRPLRYAPGVGNVRLNQDATLVELQSGSYIFVLGK